MTRILNCLCRNEFQDQRYGLGRRLHNRTNQTSKGAASWRCTICSTERAG